MSIKYIVTIFFLFLGLVANATNTVVKNTDVTFSPLFCC